MSQIPLTRGTRFRFGISLMLGLSFLGAEQLWLSRIPDSARELDWLNSSRENLADATDQELARWKQRAFPAKSSNGSTWRDSLRVAWESRDLESVSDEVRLWRSDVSPCEWSAILSDLRQLESHAGIWVDHIRIETDGEPNRGLTVEITVRQKNVEPLASRERLRVPGAVKTGSDAASRDGAALGQVRCSSPPRLSA
jgi:hypothetical protein